MWTLVWTRLGLLGAARRQTLGFVALSSKQIIKPATRVVWLRATRLQRIRRAKPLKLQALQDLARRFCDRPKTATCAGSSSMSTLTAKSKTILCANDTRWPAVPTAVRTSVLKRSRHTSSSSHCKVHQDAETIGAPRPFDHRSSDLRQHRARHRDSNPDDTRCRQNSESS
jgi:hypothetical protein